MVFKFIVFEVFLLIIFIWFCLVDLRVNYYVCCCDIYYELFNENVKKGRNLFFYDGFKY